jgi:U3 small nucleolar RNA-associated protein 14
MKMVEKKRKSRDGKKHDRPPKFNKTSKFNKKSGKRTDEKRRTGPRLPQSLRKELDRVNRNDQYSSEEDDDEGVSNDVYEYEEGVPEEESKKNRRFDSIENYEYQLPEDFEVSSSASLFIA